MGEVTLIIGGARSGKSRFAEALAAEAGGGVVYLATLEPLDEEMRLRVERHRASRPASWVTVEEPLDPLAALRRHQPYDICLFDCLTLWVSNLLLRTATHAERDDALEGQGSAGSGEKNDGTSLVLDRLGALIDWQRRQTSRLIIVTNEVGGGLVPEYELGRAFRDLLGEANQIAALAADRAYLCVAGYALDLKAAGSPIVRS